MLTAFGDACNFTEALIIVHELILLIYETLIQLICHPLTYG